MQEMQDEIKSVIQLMTKFGKALDIDTSFVGSEINPGNLLAFMGMIEQTVTEMMHASGISSATPAKSVLSMGSASKNAPSQLDFHLPEHASAQMGDSDDSDDDDAVEFEGAEAFRKKMEMKLKM